MVSLWRLYLISSAPLCPIALGNEIIAAWRAKVQGVVGVQGTTEETFDSDESGPKRKGPEHHSVFVASPSHRSFRIGALPASRAESVEKAG